MTDYDMLLKKESTRGINYQNHLKTTTNQPIKTPYL